MNKLSQMPASKSQKIAKRIGLVLLLVCVAFVVFLAALIMDL